MLKKSFLLSYLILVAIISSSSTSLAANVYDLAESEGSPYGYNDRILQKFQAEREKRLDQWLDISEKCEFTKSYVAQIIRRMQIFSELNYYSDKKRPFELRMACHPSIERSAIKEEFGVFNFGLEYIPQIKTEDHLAAFIALSLARYISSYDKELLSLKMPLFVIGRSFRVQGLNNEMVSKIDIMAAKILLNSGYDAFALIDILDLNDGLQNGVIVQGKNEVSLAGGNIKRRENLKNFLASIKVQPNKQTLGHVSRVQREAAQILKASTVSAIEKK